MKDFRTPALVSDSTYAATSGEFAFAKFSVAKLKGKDQPIQLYPWKRKC